MMSHVTTFSHCTSLVCVLSKNWMSQCHNQIGKDPKLKALRAHLVFCVISNWIQESTMFFRVFLSSFIEFYQAVFAIFSTFASVFYWLNQITVSFFYCSSYSRSNKTSCIYGHLQETKGLPISMLFAWNKNWRGETQIQWGSCWVLHDQDVIVCSFILYLTLVSPTMQPQLEPGVLHKLDGIIGHELSVLWYYLKHWNNQLRHLYVQSMPNKTCRTDHVWRGTYYKKKYKWDFAIR